MISKIITIFQRGLSISKVGSTTRDKLLLFILPIWLPFRRRAVPGSTRTYEASIFLGEQISKVYIASSTDVAALWEVFINKEYEVPSNIDPRIIFDLGSHVGMSVTYFAMKFPSSHIYCFEPDPQNFKRLKLATSQFSNITLRECAIGGEAGEGLLYQSHDASMSSSLKKRSNESHSTAVNVISLGDAIRDAGVSGVDVLKFDIEGAEGEAFSDLKSTELIKYLIGEVHFDLMNIPKSEFQEFFSGFHSTEFDPLNNMRAIFRASQKTTSSN